MPADSVDPDKVAIIQREGIGIKQEAFTGATIEGTAYQFVYRASTPGTAVAGWYLIVISTVYGFVSQGVTIEVGPVVVDNGAYEFTIDDESVIYVADPSDDTEAVRDGLITVINDNAWGFSVAASPVGSNRIYIIISDLDVVASTARNLVIFKSGYYVEFSHSGGPVKEYLIEQNSAVTDYPPFGTLASSYLYADLIIAPTGIENLLYTPAYTQDFFIASDPETIDITESPEVTLPASNRCLYANDRIYFGTPLNLGERVKMTIL